MPNSPEPLARAAFAAAPDPAAYAVVLCTYNGSNFIDEQLSSIIDAKPACDELVVVDDASGDTTVPIVKRLSHRVDGRFVFARNPRNVGSLRSFERALKMTTAPVVFLSDQDDRWHPDKVRRMLAEFKRRPGLLLLHTNARIVDEQMHPLGYDLFSSLAVSQAERAHIRAGDAFDTYIRRNVATGATLAIRRELLQAALPIPEGWVHDEWLATIASAIGEVDFLEEPLIDYRQHGDNQIGAVRRGPLQLLRTAFNRDVDYFTNQEMRTAALLARLLQLGPRVSPDRLDKVRAKLAHLRARRGLPRSRIGRFLPVLREAVGGGYARYSTGLRSVITDLCRRS